MTTCFVTRGQNQRRCGPVSLWKAGIQDGLDGCGPGRAFHKGPRRFTGVFGGPVQRVGKLGGLSIDIPCFCKFPDLQRPVLGKGTGDQIAFPAELEQLFHFSCLNYGDYCFVFIFNFYFLLPVAGNERGGPNPPHAWPFQGRPGWVLPCWSMLRWYQNEQKGP
jgi:hypothetical protein